MKIRSKLSIQFIVITVGIYGLSMLFVYNQFKNHLEAEMFNNLESRARMTAEMILIHEDELKPTPDQKPSESIQINDIGNTSIYDHSLTRVYSLISSAPSTPVTALKAIKQAGESRFVLNPYKAYGYVYTTRKNNDYVVVAEDKPDYTKLEQLRNILFISTLITLLIVAFGGWFFAGQSLRPVSRIMHEVTNILPNDLSNRLKIDNNKDELSQLIITFNSLLDRIENAFKTEKSFISNVSHELKNPIAAIHTQIQYAANKERSTVEYKRILSSLQEDVTSMSTTIEKLLQLARVHSNIAPIQLSATRLDELVYQSQAAVIHSNPEYKINIEMIDLPIDEEGMIILANEPLLKLAIMNLMENACKFSNDHTSTTFLDFKSYPNIKLKIQNNGKLIPIEDWDKIFHPFHRSHGHTPIKGSGIGLSLVKSIVELHKLDIEVASDSMDGTRFTIFFHPMMDQSHKKQSILIPSFATKSAAFPIGLFLLFSLFLSSCLNDRKMQDQTNSTTKIINSWYQEYLELNRFTDGYRPPVSARTFAYIGIGGWEAIAINNDQAISLQTHFHDMKIPAYFQKSYDLNASLNALYYTFSTLFYPNADMATKSDFKKLYESILATKLRNSDTAIVMESDRFGRNLANAVFGYGSMDSIGHLGYLYNFDHQYKLDDKPGFWKPTGLDQMPALLPHWGKARIFIPSTRSIKAKTPIPYSESQNSDFFSQAWEIYTISKSLSPEKKWIAEYWSDDFHGVTYCAVTRWISITLQAIHKKNDLDPLKELELMARLGFALNDAAVKAWDAKYTYYVERPETYIQRMIQPNWMPLHDSPSFPSYLSGHSIFGASAASILEYTFGNDFKMSDNSHDGRKEFLSKPRVYNSFKEMATENALSRMYLGVHYRADCEEGLRLGYLIGDEVLKLKMRKDGSVFNH